MILETATAEDIAWLAGYLEADGSFGCEKGYNSPRVHVYSSDLDVIESIVRLIGSGNKVTTIDRSKTHVTTRPEYSAGWSGNNAIALMLTVLPHIRTDRKIETICAIIRLHLNSGQPPEV